MVMIRKICKLLYFLVIIGTSGLGENGIGTSSAAQNNRSKLKNRYKDDNDKAWHYPLTRTTFLFESEKCTHIFTTTTIQLRSGDEAESVISVCDLCGFKKIKN